MGLVNGDTMTGSTLAKIWVWQGMSNFAESPGLAEQVMWTGLPYSLWLEGRVR